MLSERLFWEFISTNVGPSFLYKQYKLPAGPLRAASMYCLHLLSYDLWALLSLLSPCLQTCIQRVHYSTINSMPHAGFDPPIREKTVISPLAQPPSHHGWINLIFLTMARLMQSIHPSFHPQRKGIYRQSPIKQQILKPQNS